MIRLITIFSFSLVVVSTACTSMEPAASQEKSEKKVEVTINGEWTLYKEEINGKTIDFKNEPTAVSLEFSKNGYFVYFDKITDKKISDSGVSEIQERYKGQFSLNDKLLKMNHFVDDSLITENFVIQKLSADELVLKNKETNTIEFYKK